MIHWFLAWMIDWLITETTSEDCWRKPWSFYPPGRRSFKVREYIYLSIYISIYIFVRLRNRKTWKSWCVNFVYCTGRKWFFPCVGCKYTEFVIILPRHRSTEFAYLIMMFLYNVHKGSSGLFICKDWRARATDDPMNLVQSRSNTDIRKYFFSQRVIYQWNSLPSEWKRSRTVNVFKTNLHKLLLGQAD